MKFSQLLFPVSALWFSSSLFALSCTDLVTVSDPERDAGHSKIALNQSEQAIVCWKIVDNGFVKGLQVATKEKSFPWSSSEALFKDEEDIQEVHCSIDSEGHKFVAWSFHPQNSDGVVLKLAHKKAEEEWSFPEQVVKEGERCFELKAGFTQPGHLQALGRSYFSKYHLNHWDKDFFEAKSTSSLYTDYYHFNFVAFGLNDSGLGYALIQDYHDQLKAYRLEEGAFVEEPAPFKTCKNWDIDFEEVQTVVDGKGNVSLFIQEEDEDEDLVTLITVSQVDKKWQTPSVLYQGENFEEVHVAVDSQGNLFAVWEYVTEDGKDSFLKAAYKPYGSSWEIFENIKGEGNFSTPNVAYNNQGSFVIVWEARERNRLNVQGVTFKTDSQTFSEINQLSPPGKFAIWPSMAFNLDGKGWITWTAITEGFEFQVQVAELHTLKFN